MSNRFRITILTLAALLTVGIVTIGAAPTASAATGACGARYTHSAIWQHSQRVTITVQKCPIWKANTPVDTGFGAPGNLGSAGSGNWFECHSVMQSYSKFGYTSRDWAYTEADNGNWGWVSAVYFGGSVNYWKGLRTCSGNEPANWA